MAMSTSRVRHLPADSQTPPLVAVALRRTQKGGGEQPLQPWPLQRQAKWPDPCGGRGRVTGEASRRWSYAVKVHQLLSYVAAPSDSSFNSSAVAAVWVVTGWFAGGANAIVNSDASPLFYRPVEAVQRPPLHHPARHPLKANSRVQAMPCTLVCRLQRG